MKWLSRALLCSSIALAAGCVFHHAKPAPPPESAAQQAKVASTAPLLLISIDAYRADYIDRGLSPTLQALAEIGRAHV